MRIDGAYCADIAQAYPDIASFQCRSYTHHGFQCGGLCNVPYMHGLGWVGQAYLERSYKQFYYSYLFFQKLYYQISLAYASLGLLNIIVFQDFVCSFLQVYFVVSFELFYYVLGPLILISAELYIGLVFAGLSCVWVPSFL